MTATPQFSPWTVSSARTRRRASVSAARILLSRDSESGFSWLPRFCVPKIILCYLRTCAPHKKFAKKCKKILHLWKIPVISQLRTNFAEMSGKSL